MTSPPRMGREGSSWTHPSLRLLEVEDPLLAIQNEARSLVSTAVERGWSGPPFDPFELARLLRIPTVPRDDLRDARLVRDQAGFKIEYNPHRPIQRVRFSVAHELAHTLLPDAANEPRHRLLPEERRQDEWQLELICNIAAAEILMPAHAFPDLSEAPLEIEYLLGLRGRYQVSTEALVLRVVELSSEPVAAVAAARLEQDGETLFRLDYLVQRDVDLRVRRGSLLESGVFSRCTAVGFTNSGIEKWEGRLVYVQAVGIPAYPGDLFPRLAAIVRPAENAEGRIAQVAYLRGNALDPQGQGVRIITQLVNDATTVWGGRSFAAQVSRKWPSAQAAFRAWANEYGLRLGTVHLIQVDQDLWLASLVAQRGFGPSTKPRIRYEALSACLHSLGDEALTLGASIHMPPVGTGLAGGDWGRIKNLIEVELAARGIPVTVYRPPDAPPDDSESESQLSLFSEA